LQETTYDLRIASRNKELQRHFSIDEEKYNVLVEMINLLDRMIHLKKDTNLIYGQHDVDMSRESDREERLVASAYYLSIFSGKKPVILTADTDFVRLMGVVPRLMGSDEFLPENELFREALKANPPGLYLKAGKRYDLVPLSTVAQFSPEFIVYNIPEDRNAPLKIWFKKLWERFSANTYKTTAVQNHPEYTGCLLHH